MKPIVVHDVRVSIFYGMFVVRDPWCDAGDEGESLLTSRQMVAGASTYQLTIQALSHVAWLRVRLWPDTPPPQAEPWDGCRQLVLHCPTGQLLVEQVTAGAAAEITLPGGAGVYGVRVCWKDRETAHDAIMDTYGRLSGAPFERLSAALRELDGMERFLIDAWWQMPLPPDEDDEDFASNGWS
jgi:hypothetical protein